MKAAKLRGQGQIGPDKRPCSLENFWAIPRRAFPYWRVPILRFLPAKRGRA